jgi:uncharacterized membrane protein YfcA
LVKLRHTVRWRSSPVLIAAGAIGVLPALHLLHHLDAGIFRVGFGIFLAAYAACMLFRPASVYLRATHGRMRDAVVGFGGGLIGGLTAMPGALPVIWCDLRGLPKDQQRGLVQPYIVAMQVFALALMVSGNGVSSQALWNLTVSLPALLAGTGLGILLFGKVNDAAFRRIVLAVLLVAGLSLVV